jgi:hypothetical protein
MSSYPKNVNFTNVKINSEQDLFLIDPSIPSDDIIMNEICANECIPPLDLIPFSNNILAALKVKGSVSIAKGLNIGFTNAEIAGTIRFDGTNFEGFNGIEWIKLDCCGSMSGADYAEYFESKLNEKISIGKTVSIDNNGYIELSENGNNNIIGVISNSYNIIGNSYDSYWHGKYEKNKYGDIIYENHKYFVDVPMFEKKNKIIKKIKKIDNKYVEYNEEFIENVPVFENVKIYDIDGKYLRTDMVQKTIKNEKNKMIKKISNNYDPTKKYIPRKDRNEWNAVALLGCVMIQKKQPTNKNWIKIKDIDEDFELWLIK